MNSTKKSLVKTTLYGIRKYLLELGSATKAELSSKLEISFPTISKFLVEMEKEGEIISVGLDESSGGRRAKRYTYNSEYMHSLAIFLERTETKYAIFNCLGEIKKQGKVPSVLGEDALHIMTSCIEKLIITFPKISSIAIGVPGSVHNGKIIHMPGYERFHNFDMKKFYENQFSLPVIVENDMNAAVLGYHHQRKIKENPSLIYLYSGQNGPGAGIMINGDVVRGSTFFAGEVSYIPQYNDQNFRQALENRSESGKPAFPNGYQTDPMSRIVAAFTAMINPHTIIFSKDEVEKALVEQITIESSRYIPSEHLPELTRSDFPQDYLYGLQSLGLDLMLNETKK